MAAHIPTTPPGVNAPGSSAFPLMHGVVPVPTPLLTAETVTMLNAIPPSALTADGLLAEIDREISRQEPAARRDHPRPLARVRHGRRSPAVRARIRA